MFDQHVQLLNCASEFTIWLVYHCPRRKLQAESFFSYFSRHFRDRQQWLFYFPVICLGFKPLSLIFYDSLTLVSEVRCFHAKLLLPDYVGPLKERKLLTFSFQSGRCYLCLLLLIRRLSCPCAARWSIWRSSGLVRCPRDWRQQSATTYQSERTIWRCPALLFLDPCLSLNLWERLYPDHKSRILLLCRCQWT